MIHNIPTREDRTKTIVLFDLDGTLIDSTEAILESFGESFRSFGADMPEEERVKSLVGLPLAEMFQRLGVAEESVDRHVESYKRHYRSVHIEKTVLLPGAREAVEYAASMARLGIVTTKTGRYSVELLEHFGIMNLFEVLIGSEDVSMHKPHPQPIWSALERMGYEDAECWMIGDTCVDMFSAAAAGINAIAVECGYGRVEELRLCAPKTAKSVQEALTSIFGEQK